MRSNYVKVPLLQQREIEMKVLGPLVRAFAAEFGEEKTFAIVRNTLREISRQTGGELSRKYGGGLSSFKKNCASTWNTGGELEMEMKADTDEELSFDVTRCEFANLYKELGFGDIGALISCDRDTAFIDGFDPTLELDRDKTLMAGDDLCNFCYKKKK